MNAPEIDVEDLVIAYLSVLNIVAAGQITARWAFNQPIPVVLVQRVAGGDDFIVDYATVDIDSFNADQTSASDLARTVHHAMRQLNAKTVVSMPDGSTVSPYGPTTIEQTPIYIPWEVGGGESGAVTDRYVGRYRINLRLPAIKGF